jgi:hypothetical protein
MKLKTPLGNGKWGNSCHKRSIQKGLRQYHPIKSPQKTKFN